MSIVEVCCCCCSCCLPKYEKEEMTIEAYEPVIPEQKKFGYPQLGEEVQSSSKKEKASSDDERLVLQQPRVQEVKETDLSTMMIPRSHSVGEAYSAKQFQERGRHHQKAPPFLPRSTSIATDECKPSRLPRQAPINAAAAFVRRSDPTVSITSPKTPMTPKKKLMLPTHATLQFNLYYDSHRGSLTVHVHQGLYFPQKKTIKSIDSYIKAILLPSRKQTLRTKVVYNSRSPAFDEILEFSGLSMEELGSQTLVLQLYYQCDAGDRYISSCFTKLRYINLLESNHITKRIDEGMGLLAVS